MRAGTLCPTRISQETHQGGTHERRGYHWYGRGGLGPRVHYARLRGRHVREVRGSRHLRVRGRGVHRPRSRLRPRLGVPLWVRREGGRQLRPHRHR